MLNRNYSELMATQTTGYCECHNVRIKQTKSWVSGLIILRFKRPVNCTGSSQNEGRKEGKGAEERDRDETDV